jgi:glycosyltransferase involved in cell wall biosynthesis
MSDRDSAPRITIVIPIYNEEGILRASVVSLVDRLEAMKLSYEIILAENGSRDRTIELCEELAARYPQVSYFSTGQPGQGNYGKALQRGIARARGEYVICDEIDLCDTDFYRRAMDLLVHDDAEMVVGSKAMKGAHDQRPLFRRAATRVINGMLRAALDFRGTDTHGLKAFRRERLLPIVRRCVIDKDLFASEFVIRAGRAGVHVVEIPVLVAEKRRPAIHLMKRVPNVLRGLARLTYTIRFKNGGDGR